MTEGWCDNEYLVLFSDEESQTKTRLYGLAVALPGFRVTGLRGWDDFIVADSAGRSFSVPTVPLDSHYLRPFALPSPLALEADTRFGSKVKWYTKPLAFGGDPHAAENAVWVSHDQHVQLVNWWNQKYRMTRSTRGA